MDRTADSQQPANKHPVPHDGGRALHPRLFPAEDMASYVDLPFENHVYKAMAGYDDHLRRTYGDYMTLPPEDQRVTHQFEAYWL